MDLNLNKKYCFPLENHFAHIPNICLLFPATELAVNSAVRLTLAEITIFETATTVAVTNILVP